MKENKNLNEISSNAKENTKGRTDPFLRCRRDKSEVNRDNVDAKAAIAHKIPVCYPFIKFAGAKKQLLSELYSSVPAKLDTYFEPFLSRGALFFYLILDKNRQFNAYLILSFNGKIEETAAGVASQHGANTSQVKIVKRWNGTSKVPLHLLYSKFLAYLNDQGSNVVKLNNDNNTSTIFSENAKAAYVTRKNSRLLKKKQYIDWIEELLQTPLSEHRKYCIWRIIAPYFIKRISINDSYDNIYHWLERCNGLKALNFDPQTKVNDSLNRAASTGYLPISLDNHSKEQDLKD